LKKQQMKTQLFIDTGSEERGVSITGFLTMLLLLLVAVGFVFYMLFGYTVPPGYFGVRQLKFGPRQGFSDHGTPPGTHWGIPGYSLVHLVPQTIQAIHFQREASTSAYSLPPLEIQTSDRATVDVDLTVLSRFYPSSGIDPVTGLAHKGPAQLFTVVGIDSQSWINHIKQIAEDRLKRTLGTISTGQFYDPSLREEQLALAHAEINRELANVGIKVDAVLLRRYTYRDDRIDQAIFQKNLQDQEERLNVSAGKLAEAHAALEQVAAEWDAKIQTLRVDGENKARVLQSEGDLYENQRRAEGDLEVAKARAEVVKLKASALAQSRVAEVYVARELAALLGSIKGGVVSQIDPYDLKEWMKRLGVEGIEQ
jgi:regulator of protease activity HflC (stomatin/prohibitin superfamily)